MPHIERTITVDKPLQQVWDYLSDFRSTNDWDPGTVRTERSSGDGGVGTVYQNTSSFLGREVEIVYTVQEFQPLRLLRLRGETDAVIATDTLTFSGSEARTTLTYRADFDFQGVAKLATPVADIPLKKLGDEAEENLVRSLSAL